MKYRSVLPLIIITALLSCAKVPQSITNGQWHYDLYMNSVKAGSAVITNSETDGLMTGRIEMIISVGTMRATTTQTVVETRDFKPVKLEITDVMEDSSTGSRQEMKRTAEFRGKEVTLVTDGKKAKFIIDEPFILDGNYFTDSLIKGKFREGMEVRAKVYEPSVETEKPILEIVNVTDRKSVMVRGKELTLIHVRERVEKLKSVDIYMNDSGIIEKMVIKMLNNIFEMERVE